MSLLAVLVPAQARAQSPAAPPLPIAPPSATPTPEPAPAPRLPPLPTPSPATLAPATPRDATPVPDDAAPAPPPPPPAPPAWEAAPSPPSVPPPTTPAGGEPPDGTRRIGFIPPPRANAEDAEAIPKNLDLLILDSGRANVALPESDVIRLQVHGEYQLRYEHLRSFPLDPTLSTVIAHPGAISDSLGQNDFAYHWLRVTPRFQLKDALEIVGQIDVLTGLVVGDLAHDDQADQTPRNSYNGFSNVQPRWLYLEWRTRVGVLRVGQQPSHWGMGIVANDGDHPSLFGDYRYGDISERVLFGAQPFGKASHVTVAAAGDLVYRDSQADITEQNYAMQAILLARYQKGHDDLGFYGVYRHQWRDLASEPLAPYLETINVGILDVAGRFAVPVPGTRAYLFGAGEGAVYLGSTNEERTALEVQTGTLTQIRSYGGAAIVGVVHVAECDCHADAKHETETEDLRTFGDLVGQIEVGYASGDANPLDDTEHRFTFNPNHKVGLLLFDEILRFQTARSAVALADPLLQNGNRATPGSNLLASNGGVFGAQYINPTFVYRPARWLDLKAGVVLAEASSDVVDPYRVATHGSYVNYLGGNAQSHDFGIETDGGFEVRIPLGFNIALALGAEAGVLFPAGALADALGQTMKTPWIALGRFGFLF